MYMAISDVAIVAFVRQREDGNFTCRAGSIQETVWQDVTCCSAIMPLRIDSNSVLLVRARVSADMLFPRLYCVSPMDFLSF